MVIFLELDRRDVIEEIDGEDISDASSILKANFADAPPLLMTKSIELDKGALRIYKDHNLDEVPKPRMLKTP